MRFTSQTNIKSKQTSKRIIALAFLICFIIVSLLSEAFILTHTEHKHDHNGVGGSCATCAQIQNAENLLKQLGMAISSGSFAFISLFVAIEILHSISSLFGFQTLVNLKIRMNN